MTKYPHSHHRDWWSKYMLNIDSMIRTKHVFCLKKYLEDYPSPWKFFLDEQLLSVGWKFVLHCNLDHLWCCCPSISSVLMPGMTWTTKYHFRFERLGGIFFPLACWKLETCYWVKIQQHLALRIYCSTRSKVFFSDEYHWLHPSPVVHNNRRFFISPNNFSSFRYFHHH